MKLGVVRKFALLLYPIVLFVFFFPFKGIHSDTLILKNLSRYENVKTIIQGDYINILFKNGDLISLNKREIKQFFPMHVDWSTTDIEKKIVLLKKNLIQRDLLQMKRGVLWRSLILPGWGNLFAGKTLEGYSYLTSFAAMAFYSRTRYLETTHAKKSYYEKGFSLLPLLFSDRPVPEMASILNFQMRERYYSETEKYNRSLNIIALLYCVQFFHSIFTANNLKEVDLSTDISWEKIIFETDISDNFSEGMKYNEYSLHYDKTVQLGIHFSF